MKHALSVAAAVSGAIVSGIGGAQTQTQIQTWPVRAITMVIPYAAGGAVDAFGRVIALQVGEVLGTRVVVENAAAAGGMTGTGRVAKAPPDGYQFALGTVGTHAINQSLFKNPLYNAATDFAPVALIAESPQVLVARKTLPVDNLQEFVAYAKANQAKMRFGSAGAGSAIHLACALLNAAIGIDVTHVPYRGGAPVMQDLIAGRIDYECPNLAVAIPQMEAREIKALAALSKERSSILPSLATAREQGLTDFAAENWIAFFLPRRTPATVVQKLHNATVEAMETPSLQKRLKDLGADVVAPERRSSEYLQQFVEAEIKKWASAIRAAGIGED
jgi:tripartite-type tricarboxylate transporter receptor subunit TctC